MIWSKVIDAKTYLLELTRYDKFKDRVDFFEVNETVLTIEKPLALGQYYWRLASIDGVDKGPYADISHFIHKAKPEAPYMSQL